MEIELVRPSLQYKDTFIKGLRALRDEGLPWYEDTYPEELEMDFEPYVRELLYAEKFRTEVIVPETILWFSWPRDSLHFLRARVPVSVLPFLTAAKQFAPALVATASAARISFSKGWRHWLAAHADAGAAINTVSNSAVFIFVPPEEWRFKR
jgi:hypothetical protein